MANPTAGFGLRPVRRLDGSAPTFQLEERSIIYNEGGSIFTGDLVQADAGGYLQPYTAGDAVIAGVFWGCKYLNPSTGRMEPFAAWLAPVLPSTSLVKGYVIADDALVFEIRTALGTAAPTTIVDIGANFEVTMATGDTPTGQSRMTAINTPAATATFPLKMVGLSKRISSGFNDPTLVNNIIEVKLNTLFWAGTAGI
jgi:hypothetical protein